VRRQNFSTAAQQNGIVISIACGAFVGMLARSGFVNPR
jgi:hypothetical protein